MAVNKLDRYIRPYKKFFAQVKTELQDGKKQTHWMWFIFPQLKGLGKSAISDYYSLDSIQDAKDFYSNKFLRDSMNELLKIVLKLRSYEQLLDCFGEIDILKFHSCATIFYVATKKRIFKKVLNKFFNGHLDKETINLLEMR